MASETCKIEDILERFFSAMESCSRVRHAQYEINLWRKRGLPLSEVAPQAKAYVSNTFMDGAKLGTSDLDVAKKGLKRLDYAEASCRAKCEKIVAELNEQLEKLGIETIENPKNFVDYYTLRYKPRKNWEGKTLVEPRYNIAIVDFLDIDEFKRFKDILRKFLKKGKIISMQDVAKIIQIEKSAKSFK